MNLIKFLFGLLMTIGGCALCYWIVMLNLLVSLTSDQLTRAGFPYFGQKVTEWQLGVPMDTYTEAGAAGAGQPVVFKVGQVKPKGYVGPKSFRCGSPVQYGYVTSRFNDIRFTDAGVPVLHHGVDYGTYHMSQDLYALMGGEVIYAGWTDVGYGNLVVIENDGVLLYLGHLDQIYVQEGSLVTAGDVVGLSGNTGNSSGPHVHVEYRYVEGDTLVPFNPEENFVPGQTEVCLYDEAWSQEIFDQLHNK
jgi:murein DD-endopeptidase MepM/ murein hydrolase activator NlpD